MVLGIFFVLLTAGDSGLTEEIPAYVKNRDKPSLLPRTHKFGSHGHAT